MPERAIHCDALVAQRQRSDVTDDTWLPAREPMTDVDSSCISAMLSLTSREGPATLRSAETRCSPVSVG